ncbi:hypothetical protein GCM10022254_10230 [Actinomadura meridiana]|uniref:Uncharacterized protein n=1 Tax=Actinomadura meridiana TaxID=559626 RepID=A0ABP8BU27_9ACTN
MTADTADALDATLAADQLRTEFPDWEIIRTDRGHWWAVPNEAGRASKRARSSVDADTPDELRVALREAIRPTAPHHGRCTR